VHAAGLAGGGVMQLKSREMAEVVLGPKVQGTLALDAALRELDLDFVVLCSSLSALFGGAGRVDYAAANCFLDAFAEWCQAQSGQPVISMDWDTWHSGMALDLIVPAAFEEWQAEAMEGALLPGEGGAALARAIDFGVPQIAVSTRDLEVRRLLDRHGPEGHEPEVPSTWRSNHARPALANPYVAPESPTQKAIAGVWEELLGVDKIGLEDNFFELGGHSLLAIQVVSRLRTRFQAELSAHTVFESPTVAELAARVDVLSGSALDDASMAQVLEHIEQLPDDMVEALLAANAEVR
jgi:acyl carrier protein